MALATALLEIASYVSGISRVPPFVRVTQLSLEKEPFDATETTRHFELLDGGLVRTVCNGAATKPRVELRNITLRIKYCTDGDFADLEGVVATDREAITTLLNDPATHAASTSIEAILLDVSSSIEENKDSGYFILTMGLQVHVAIY